MAKRNPITGTDLDEFLRGSSRDETIFGRGGNDLIFGRGGADRLFGERGFDTMFGDAGDDMLRGGTQGDILDGGTGDDVLHGDDGRGTVKGTDFASDVLAGGDGDDRLCQSEGNDTLTGGDGRDSFYFKWQDPMIALAAGTGRAFANITDFDPRADRLLFDAAGIGADAAGANFLDGGDGTVGGRAASFFTGAAADSNGQAVMVLTDTGFVTGLDAVAAAQGEALGDFVLYFNTTVNVASLLFVDGTDTAHSIARFANIDSLDELADAGFRAGDFIFV
jgi:Ca2+-binding RTX toxin-like protein